ncbi:hypothetical protein XPA_008706 [Xanthoria parietina]
MLPAYSLRPRAAKPPGTLQLFPANIGGMCNVTPSQAKDLKSCRTLRTIEMKLTAFPWFQSGTENHQPVVRSTQRQERFLRWDEKRAGGTGRSVG